MMTNLNPRPRTRSRFSAWIRRSRQLALPGLSALLLALALPLPLAALTPVAPDESPAWWLQVKDDWDEAWERAWSREGRESEFAEDETWPRGGEGDWEGDWLREEGGLVRFRYTDAGYEEVALTGDWLDWGRLSMDFLPEEQCWALSLALAPGRHHYRFIVRDEEGEWEAIDPANSEAKRLDDGGWVSVVVTGGWDEGETEHWHEERSEWRRLRAELARDDGAPQFPCAEQDCDQDGTLSAFLDYQRVDGLVFGFSPRHLAESDFELSVQGLIAYGFESERWSAGLTVLQPLVPGQRLWLKLQGASGTTFAPRTGIGDEENLLAVALLREDYRDYFRREGAAFSLVAAAPAWLRVEAGLRSEDHEAICNTATWSVHSGHFRTNLPIDAGTLRSVFGSLRLGTPFNHLAVAWERAGEDVLGGDFGYSLAEATLRSRVPLGDAQHLDLRVKGASNLRGALPLQRRFLLGGLGSVRGYDYQSLLVAHPEGPQALYGGERMLLANLEYGFGLLDEFDLFALYDAGMAWADRDAEFALKDLKDSAGLGLGSADAGLRLNLMRSLDGSEETVFELRLERAF
jgi:hypothetical protein